MRFICPSCETEYDIPDGKVRNAFKLRCHVCGCVSKMPVTVQNEEDEKEDFLQKTESDSSVDPYAEHFIEDDFSAFIPVKKQKNEPEPPLPNDFFAPPETPYIQNNAKKNMQTALMLFCFSVVLLIASVFIKIYGKVLPPPVGFENVSYYFTEEDHKRFLVITGTLVNKTSENVSVPEFSIRFFNKANVMLAKQKIPTVLPLLTPESTLPFSLRVERPPSSAEKLELSPQNISVAPVKKEQATDTKKAAEKETAADKKNQPVTPAKANPSATPESRPTSANGG